MRVRVGVQVQPQHGEFDRMRRAWREAEEIGADCIYTWDHFYPLRGEPEGRHFEGLACLASLAENTQRAEVGALVFCNSYRNPNLLADAHRTIDHISGGRSCSGSAPAGSPRTTRSTATSSAPRPTGCARCAATCRSCASACGG